MGAPAIPATLKQLARDIIIPYTAYGFSQMFGKTQAPMLGLKIIVKIISAAGVSLVNEKRIQEWPIASSNQGGGIHERYKLMRSHNRMEANETLLMAISGNESRSSK